MRKARREDILGKGKSWGSLKREFMYKITFLPDAEESFKKLDKPIQKRIAQKIDWLAENADKVIHHTLTPLPDDLRGLCRMRL